MSTSSTENRIDPLIDAYRQASELDAQSAGARPRATLRAAVLAHARVVAQSAATAEPKLAVSEAVRARPAANESKPVWRMVAGVLLGLAGMWAYQLTRPGATDEANVAVMTAPQSEKSAATELPRSTDSAVTLGAAATVAPATSASVTTGAPAQRETTVAVATLPAPAPALPATVPAPVVAAREMPTRDGAVGTGNRAGVSGLREERSEAARSDTSVALATADVPEKRVQQAAPVDARTAIAAAAEATTTEPSVETVIASAERRKAARQSAAPEAGAAPPNAFPATTTGAMATAAPPPAAPAMSPQSAAAGASATLRQGGANTADTAMFRAIRIGDVNALRAALARGANLSARDETGRSALQIARDRSDMEILKALELAGAK